MSADAYIVIGIVVLVLIGIGTFFLLKFLKGKLALTLNRGACNAGETLGGSVRVTTKRTVESTRLFVALIGVKEIRERRRNRTHLRRDEIYRSEVDLEGARTYPAGYQQTYLFEVPTPEMSGGNLVDSELGKALQFGIGLFTSLSQSSRIVWRVEARLDAKGVDLTAQKGVTVNLPRI